MRLWATTPPLPAEFPEALRTAPLSDHPHIGDALSSNLPILVPDKAIATLSPAERQAVEQRNLRTVLYLPLIAGLKSVGTLIVGSVGSPRPVSSADIDLCRTLANLAALAVANAQLFESTQRQAEQLRQTLTERDRAEEARENLRLQLLHAQKMESIGRLVSSWRIN